MPDALLTYKAELADDRIYRELLTFIANGCKVCGCRCPYSERRSSDPDDLPEHCIMAPLIAARASIDADRLQYATTRIAPKPAMTVSGNAHGIDSSW